MLVANGLVLGQKNLGRRQRNYNDEVRSRKAAFYRPWMGDDASGGRSEQRVLLAWAFFC